MLCFGCETFENILNAFERGVLANQVQVEPESVGKAYSSKSSKDKGQL